jgi:hypothetical protein
MKRTTILAISVPVLLAAGCSGGASNAGRGSAPPPTTSPPTTQPSTTAPSSGAAKPVTSRCRTGDLKLTAGEGEGAAGTEYQALVFTNTSNRTCTLYGYPGVSWVAGDQGTQVGDPFQRGGTHRKVTITLKPGRAAHANLQLPNAANYDAATCKPVSVRGLRVYPPDETAAVFVRLPSQQCSAKGVNVDTVWAISAGARLDPQ